VINDHNIDYKKYIIDIENKKIHYRYKNKDYFFVISYLENKKCKKIEILFLLSFVLNNKTYNNELNFK